MTIEMNLFYFFISNFWTPLSVLFFFWWRMKLHNCEFGEEKNLLLPFYDRTQRNTMGNRNKVLLEIVRVSLNGVAAWQRQKQRKTAKAKAKTANGNDFFLLKHFHMSIFEAIGTAARLLDWRCEEGNEIFANWTSSLNHSICSLLGFQHRNMAFRWFHFIFILSYVSFWTSVSQRLSNWLDIQHELTNIKESDFKFNSQGIRYTDYARLTHTHSLISSHTLAQIQAILCYSYWFCESSTSTKINICFSFIPFFMQYRATNRPNNQTTWLETGHKNERNERKVLFDLGFVSKICK